VRVTKYGREPVYIVSAETFHALKQGRRDAIAAADLTDEEAALIAAAQIPPEHRHSPHTTPERVAIPRPAPGLVISYAWPPIARSMVIYATAWPSRSNAPMAGYG